MNATEAALLAREHLSKLPEILPDQLFETKRIHLIDGGYQVECKVYSAAEHSVVPYVVAMHGGTIISIGGSEFNFGSVKW